MLTLTPPLSRRSFLAGIAGLPLSSLLARAAPRARIERVETVVVPVNRRGNWVLVRLHASGGLSGIGEASHGRSDRRAVELVNQFFEVVKGRGLDSVEHLRREAAPVVAKEGMNGAVALSGLEQCLWDMAGKAYGVPAYALFGGKLDGTIRNYANINRSTDERTPAGFAAMAEKAVARGFDAIKLASFDGGAPAEVGIACVEAVRKAIGPKVDLLVDAHSHFTLESGLELARRFEPLNLFWLEEVTRGIEGLAAINRAAKMPTAGGESLFGVKRFQPYIAGGAVDIVMPDVKYCGGMLELKKIAAMAEGAGLEVSPHGPASPVGNMAAAQVSASLPNFSILEYSFGEVPWREEIVDPPEVLHNGRMILSDRPGLGLEWNERELKKRASAAPAARK